MSFCKNISVISCQFSWPKIFSSAAWTPSVVSRFGVIWMLQYYISIKSSRFSSTNLNKKAFTAFYLCMKVIFRKVVAMKNYVFIVFWIACCFFLFRVLILYGVYVCWEVVFFSINKNQDFCVRVFSEKCLNFPRNVVTFSSSELMEMTKFFHTSFSRRYLDFVCF